MGALSPKMRLIDFADIDMFGLHCLYRRITDRMNSERFACEAENIGMYKASCDEFAVGDQVVARYEGVWYEATIVEHTDQAIMAMERDGRARKTVQYLKDKTT